MNNVNRSRVSKGHFVLFAALLAGLGLFGSLVATRTIRNDSAKGAKVRAPRSVAFETPAEEPFETPSLAGSAESQGNPAGSEPRANATENRVSEWNAYLATFDRPDEVVERRDSYARHFRNPEGGYTALISPTPIQYRHSDGSWQPVDLEVRHENGRYVNRTNVLKSEFPVVSTDPDGARIGLSPEESYQWRPLSIGTSDAAGRYTSLYLAAPVAASAGAGEIEYGGIFPNATDRFRIESSLVKHDLVLTEMPSLPASVDEGGTFDYVGEVQLAPGLTFELGTTFTSSGGVWVVNQKGEHLFELAPPLAREVEGRGSTAGAYRVCPLPATDLYELRIQIPLAWLVDPSRKFPVEIDPTTYPNRRIKVATSYAKGIDDPRFLREATSDDFGWSSWWGASDGAFANEDGYGTSRALDCAVGWDFDRMNEFYHSSVEWDISSIPDGNDIAIGQVFVKIKVAPYNYCEFDYDNIHVAGHSMEYPLKEYQLGSRTPMAHYFDCTWGNYYLDTVLEQGTGRFNDYLVELDPRAASDLQKKRAVNWFGLGLTGSYLALERVAAGSRPIDEVLSDRGVITLLHESPLEVRWSRTSH